MPKPPATRAKLNQTAKAAGEARARVSKMSPAQKAALEARAREKLKPKPDDRITTLRAIRRAMVGMPAAERQQLLNEAMAIVEAGADGTTVYSAVSLTQLLNLDNEDLNGVTHTVVSSELKAAVEAFLLPIFTKLSEAQLIYTEPRWCAEKVAGQATAVLTAGWLKSFK